MKIPKWLRDHPIFIKLLRNEKSSMSSDNSSSVILSKQTFELRMTSLKVKQINPLLRLTKVLFVLLFKVINVSPLFKTKTVYTFTNKTALLSIKTGDITSP